MAAQNRALKQERDSLRKQIESLKATVARYQKALKEPPVPAAPAPAAPQAGLAPVNVNTASANDMVLFLGITKEEADRVVAGRPYKVKQEILLKNALPKARFDAIKDRISVAK